MLDAVGWMLYMSGGCARPILFICIIHNVIMCTEEKLITDYQRAGKSLVLQYIVVLLLYTYRFAWRHSWYIHSLYGSAYASNLTQNPLLQTPEKPLSVSSSSVHCKNKGVMVTPILGVKWLCENNTTFGVSNGVSAWSVS